MKDQLIVPLSSSFQKDYQVLTLTIMSITRKKYKKVAKGEILFYKKYLNEEKREIEKWINLSLFKSQIDNTKYNTDTLKGKIYMKIFLPENNKDDANKIQIKDPIQANKTKKYKSELEKCNNYLNINKSKNHNEIVDDLLEDIFQLNDGLFNISNTSLKLDPQQLDVNELNNEKFIENMKIILNNDPKKIFPNNLEELKKLNDDIYNNFCDLKESYDNIINELKSNNEFIQQKAKNTCEQYKTLEESLYNEREKYMKEKEELKKQMNENIEKNNKLSNEINTLNKEIEYFKNEMDIEKPKQNNKSENNIDIDILSNILKKIHGLGYDIFNGSELKGNEKQKVKYLLNLEDLLDPILLGEEEEFEMGNRIVGLIEASVNNLYFQKVIHNVKIDQINVCTYDFEDQNQKLTVILKIESGQLICGDGMKFTDWLVKNFKEIE